MEFSEIPLTREILGGHKLSRDQESLLFKAFNTIFKTSPAGVQAYGSDRLVQRLADEIDSKDENIMNSVGSQEWDAMIDRVMHDIHVEYEKAMDEFYNAFRDVFSIP